MVIFKYSRPLTSLCFAIGKLPHMVKHWKCSHQFAVICISFMVKESILRKTATYKGVPPLLPWLATRVIKSGDNQFIPRWTMSKVFWTQLLHQTCQKEQTWIVQLLQIQNCAQCCVFQGSQPKFWGSIFFCCFSFTCRVAMDTANLLLDTCEFRDSLLLFSFPIWSFECDPFCNFLYVFSSRRNRRCKRYNDDNWFDGKSPQECATLCKNSTHHCVGFVWSAKGGCCSQFWDSWGCLLVVLVVHKQLVETHQRTKLHTGIILWSFHGNLQKVGQNNARDCG